MAYKTVLVTGATGGIGSEIAIKFAKEGWDVLCHYNSSNEEARKIKSIIEKNGSQCYLIKADLTLLEQVNDLIVKLNDFDICALINNAGSYVGSKYFSELTIHDITDTFMVNSFAPILITSKLFTKMKEKCFGRVVNISSIASKYGGSSYSMHYGCSKLSLEGLTKTLSREGAGSNVLVNTIRPGVIDTYFHKKYPKDWAKRVEMIPLKRKGKPKDIADMVYYLGSDKNSFITNEIITIAGGE